MKVALIGASGKIGSHILEEAVTRGHQITAIARNPDNIAPKSGVIRKHGDLTDGTPLAEILRDHDAIISSVRFKMFKSEQLIDTVRQCGVKRLIVVGGAGTLEIKPGVTLLDTPEFPLASREEGTAGRAAFEALKQANDLDWTFLSPSAVIGPGERTGKFRIGGDTLLVGGDGKSRISFADFAIALVDELEQARHVRRRFTVGY